MSLENMPKFRINEVVVIKSDDIYYQVKITGAYFDKDKNTWVYNAPLFGKPGENVCHVDEKDVHAMQ